MPSRSIVCGAHQPVAEQVQPQPGVLRCRRAVPAGPRPRCAPRAGARRGPRRRPPAGPAPRGRPGRRRARPGAGRGTRRRARRPRPRSRRTSRGRSPRRDGRCRRCGRRRRRVGVEESRRNATQAGQPGLTGPAGWMGGMPLDLTVDAVQLTEDLVEHRVGQRQRAGRSPTRSRRRCAGWTTSRCSGSGTPSSPAPDQGRDERVVIAGHLDTVPAATPTCRAPATTASLHGLGQPAT